MRLSIPEKEGGESACDTLQVYMYHNYVSSCIRNSLSNSNTLRS